MKSEIQTALATVLLAAGDDELILGQRNSEWCGQAPILEEDIAFANLALDELGHAGLWYSLLAQLTGERPSYADRLVYFRKARDFRNIQMVELPNGDWAFSMLRQFLFDAYEGVRLEALTRSRYTPLAEAAAKIRKEEMYHFRHSQAWIRRLGLGTPESHQRTQTALQLLWPYTHQLFVSQPGEDQLVEAGILPPGLDVQASWAERVLACLDDCGLEAPITNEASLSREQHTPAFFVLVAEMQSVARLDTSAEW